MQQTSKNKRRRETAFHRIHLENQSFQSQTIPTFYKHEGAGRVLVPCILSDLFYSRYRAQVNPTDLRSEISTVGVFLPLVLF